MADSEGNDREHTGIIDGGVAATGYVCQNEPEHPDDQPEVEMASSGPGEPGRVCPESGRMAAGPDDEIPYGDPPDYRPSEGLFGPLDRDMFREAIETWGLPAQIDMAVEECGEVIVALQHLQRGRTDREEVIAELADLRIMFEQLRWYFGRDFVDPVIDEKMDRLRERLDRSQPTETDRPDLRTDGGRKAESSDVVPWSELSERERENFRSLLHDRGITVSVEAAEAYYGNPEKVEGDATRDADVQGKLCPRCHGQLTREGLLLEGDPGFCPHCGEDLSADGDPSVLVEEVTVRVTRSQLGALEHGAELTDATVEEFCREAIRGRLQALENVLAEVGDGT